MQSLSVGEVARRSGLRPSAVRYYERAGIIPPAPRVGGQRRYDGRVFGYLTLIRIAKQVGFTLADTRELARACSAGSPPTARADAIARRKLVELEARIREAQQMRRFLMQLLRLTTRSRKDGPR